MLIGSQFMQYHMSMQIVKDIMYNVCILICQMFICCSLKMHVMHPNKHPEKNLHKVAGHIFDSAKLYCV